ncbi:MAG: efflux RND transporter periplasmic adaptor subunit [Gammaproteobacteria bacterium]|nr:efflux RND transporter periplasmic adaptor subunit [Gammaproteobacteria bacterium]
MLRNPIYAVTVSASIVFSSAIMVFSSGLFAEEATVPNDLIYIVEEDKTGNSAVFGGGVIPHKMVKLLAQMPGEVDFIAGEEGDAFKTGSQLVRLDADSLLAKRQAAEAGLNSARAGLGNAYVQYRRELLTPNSQANSMMGGVPGLFSMFGDPLREMAGEGDPDFERHSSLYGQGVQIQAAQGQVRQAEAGIRELDETLENTISLAPFDGVIVKKMVEVGDIVQPGMPLVIFADTSRMQIQVEIPTRLVNKLKEGQIVGARLDRGGDPTKAKIARIFPMANLGGHTTTVKFDLPVGAIARPGMYAEVIIPDSNKQKKGMPSIPASAISWRGSLPAVFLVSDDNTSLKMKTMRLGSKVPGGKIAVLSGVSVGDKILRQPLASTRSGKYQAAIAE